MNGFTKEELHILADALCLVYLSEDSLRNKVKSMIDNYCEHEPSDAHYEQFRWQLCSKCGVQYK